MESKDFDEKGDGQLKKCIEKTIEFVSERKNSDPNGYN